MIDSNRLPPDNLLRGRIPSLDGLRALAFLLVFVSHMGLMGGRTGGFGVNVFFSISGYLITNLLIREWDRTGTISLRNFYLRRTARIFPGMYAVSVMCILLVSFHLISGVLKWGAVLFELLYLQNYSSMWGIYHGDLDYGIPWTSSFWSLCVEEHFYLLFPFLFLFLLRRLSFKQVAGTLAGVCFVLLAWRLVAVRLIPFGEEWCYRTTDSRMDSIIWGCILACVEQVPKWRAFLTRANLEQLLAPLGLALLIGTFIFHDSGHMTTRFTLQAIGLLPLVFYVTHYAETPVARFLNLRLLVHLGTLSYGLYLIHYPIIQLIRAHVRTSEPILWVLCAVATYLAALVMHWTLERPFETIRARLRKA